jgi:membrane-associated phospholipid phosphatase
MQSHYHPKQALYWYSGATLIAASRVQLDRHHVHDVLAGAAVGYLTSRFELSRPHGLLLAPFVHGDSTGRHAANSSAGLQLTKVF